MSFSGGIRLGMDITWKVGVTALLACLFGVLGSVVPARAALVDLDIFVSNALLSENGDPLADGSWVFVYGSGDDVADPMATWGGTNVIAGSTTGDDVILGAFQLTSVADFGVPGFFFNTFQYEDTLVNHTYIRFFNNTNGPVLTGMIYWGESLVYTLSAPLGVANVDVNPNNDLQTTNINNFVIIPEPNTFNLFLLVGGMMWAMRSSMRRQVNKSSNTADHRPWRDPNEEA